MATQEYTTVTNTTWTLPSDTPSGSSVIAECWGSGGGGGAGNPSGSGGSGGGGGAYAKKTWTVGTNITAGNAYNVYIPDGGAGGVQGGTTAGQPPADKTYFWSNDSSGCVADKGLGGAYNGGTAGAGGTVANSYGDTEYYGGAGLAGASNGGRAGGTSAGIDGNGTTATSASQTTPTATEAGYGGAAGTSGGAVGSPGGDPGGGGGGGDDATNGNGGKGGVGKIRITYSLPAGASFDPFGMQGFFGM